MKLKIAFPLLLYISWSAVITVAQIPKGNTAGVAMGHLHLNVRDVEANKKFFTAIGGVALKAEPFDVIKFPDVLIFLNLFPGAPPASGGMVGTVVDHFGFLKHP